MLCLIGEYMKVMFMVPELSKFVLEFKATVDDLVPEVADVISYESYITAILDSDIYLNDSTVLDVVKNLFKLADDVDLSAYDMHSIMSKIVWVHSVKFEQIRMFICDLISYLQISLDSCRLDWTSNLAIVFEVDNVTVEIAG